MQHYGRGPWAYAAAVAGGILLYVCEGAEVPLTVALLELGIAPGPAFTFLLASVGTCLPTIMMAPRIIGAMATMVYLFVWLTLAIGGGLVMQFIVGCFFVLKPPPSLGLQDEK